MRKLIPLVALLAACVSVDETEHCVGTRYGKIEVPQMSPGLEFAPLMDVTCFPKTQQQFPSGVNAKGEANVENINIPTRDSVIVAGEISFLWDYANPGAAFTEKRSHDAVLAELSNAVRTGARDAGATIVLADLFGTKRATLDDVFREAIQKKAPSYVRIIRVYVRGMEAPEQIQVSWRAAMEQRAKQEQIRSQYVSDSLNSVKAIMLAEAEAKATVVTAEAAAKAKELETRALATSPEVLRLKQAEALAAGLKGICSGAAVTTCSIGQQTLADILGRFGARP